LLFKTLNGAQAIKIEELLPQSILVRTLRCLGFLPRLFLIDGSLLPFIDLRDRMIYRREGLFTTDRSDPPFDSHLVVLLQLIQFGEFDLHVARPSAQSAHGL
jgi:hypothetical protein